MRGWREGTQACFYIGSGSRIRIRDGSLRWCTDNRNSDSPFLFRPGAFYTVELTAETAGLSRDMALIWSGADKEGSLGGGRTNIIDGAILELELTESYEHRAGEEIRIFQYDGELAGQFAGLPDKAAFFVDGHRFRIDYGTGAEDVIALTALPAEGTLMLLR